MQPHTGANVWLHVASHLDDLRATWPLACSPPGHHLPLAMSSFPTVYIPFILWPFTFALFHSRISPLQLLRFISDESLRKPNNKTFSISNSLNNPLTHSLSSPLSLSHSFNSSLSSTHHLQSSLISHLLAPSLTYAHSVSSSRSLPLLLILTHFLLL